MADIADQVPWLGRTMPAWLHANEATAASLLRTLCLHETAGLPAKCVAHIRVFASELAGCPLLPRKTCVLRHVLLGAVMNGCLSLCRFLQPIVWSSFNGRHMSASLVSKANVTKCNPSQLARPKSRFDKEVLLFTEGVTPRGGAQERPDALFSLVFLHFKTHFVYQLLGAAVRHGHVHICRWLEPELLPIFHSDEANEQGCCLLRKKVHILFTVAAGRGHLEVCRWLHRVFKLTNEEARRDHDAIFFVAMKAGHVAVCRWVLDTFPSPEPQSPLLVSLGLIRIAEKGHLDMANWLHGQYPALFCGTAQTPRAMMNAAVQAGQLAVCQWVLRLAGTDLQDSKAMLAWIRTSVVVGHVDVCSYLLSALPADAEALSLADLVLMVVKCTSMTDATRLAMCECLATFLPASPKPDLTQAMKVAAKKGDLAMCQWLYVRSSSTHWTKTESDMHIFQVHGKLFVRALRHGHIPVAVWVDSMQMKIRHYKLFRVFSDMARNGHLAALVWAHEQCDYIGAFVHSETSLLMSAMFNVQVNVCEWIMQTFPVDAEAAWHGYRNSGATFLIVKRGDVRMCCWLIDFAASVYAANPQSFCVNGAEPIDARAWAYQQFWAELRSSLIRHYRHRHNEAALGLAASLGHLEMCQWIAQHYPTEVQHRSHVVEDAFSRALQHNHLHVCRWLYPFVAPVLLTHPILCRQLYTNTASLPKATRLWLYLILQRTRTFVHTSGESMVMWPLFERGDWDVCLFLL